MQAKAKAEAEVFKIVQFMIFLYIATDNQLNIII